MTSFETLFYFSVISYKTNTNYYQAIHHKQERIRSIDAVIFLTFFSYAQTLIYCSRTQVCWMVEDSSRDQSVVAQKSIPNFIHHCLLNHLLHKHPEPELPPVFSSSGGILSILDMSGRVWAVRSCVISYVRP